MKINGKNNLTYYNKTNIDNQESQFRRSLSLNRSKNFIELRNYQNNYNTDLDNYINAPRNNYLFKEKEEKKDYQFYNNSLNDLISLNIDKNILEGIYNNKNLLIRNMKQKDRHGDGLITKFDFLSIFHKTNCHYKLRIEIINKIVNIYFNNSLNVIMINYTNLINALCQDIKIIINKNYDLNHINKYSSPYQNKFLRGNYFFKRTRNLNNNSISSLNTFQDLPYIEEFNVKEIINKINKISSELIQNERKNISLFDLISLLEQKNIYLNKTQALQLLKYLEIQNSNSFGLNEFIEKVKTKSNNLFNTISLHRSFNSNNITKNKENERYNKTINSGFGTSLDKKIFQSKNISETKNHKINNIKLFKSSINKTYNNKESNTYDEEKENNIMHEKLKEHEIIVNSIKIIQNKIYEFEYRLDLISEYFDTLLSYDIFRLDNIIYPDEFEKVINYEKFNFSKKVKKRNKFIIFFYRY